MTDQGIRYTYDGTFEGYLCAVLAALRSGKVPASITDRRMESRPDIAIHVATSFKDAQYLYSTKYGAKIAEDYSSELMNGIQMAIRDLYREAQSILQELDFYIGEEASCTVINPRNSVLPIIRKPVLKRRDISDFIIYDKRHHLLLERNDEQNMLLDISDFPVPDFKDPAEAYSHLWPFGPL